MEKTIKADSSKIVNTIANFLKIEGYATEYELFSKGQIDIEISSYDNWDGGTYGFRILCKVPIEIYVNLQDKLSQYEETITNKAQHVFKGYERCWVDKVAITPQISDVPIGKEYQILNDDLLQALEQQKSLMVSVSTGGPQIKLVNADYIQRKKLIEKGLEERSIKNVIIFSDLWKWHGKWSDGSLPQYKDRREYLAELFDPLIEKIKQLPTKSQPAIFEEPTGWSRVDRSMREIRAKLALAENEEQFQGVGLLCRETLISLAQAIFIKEKHPSLDGAIISATDSKRMLESYIAHEFQGSSNEVIRKMAKTSVELANVLTHSRTADFRLAALSAEVTNSVVNLFSILAGRRDKYIKE